MFRPRAALVAGMFLIACSSSSTPDVPATAGAETIDAGTDSGGPELLPGCPLDPDPPVIEVDSSSGVDPTGGAKNFTLEQALAGYPESEGVLTALITTEKGTIRCELDEEAAPVTVANFVGLARGTRPYRALSGGWKANRYYDGLLWHRVIPDFMIQGGDQAGKGTGGPGYSLPEENHVAEPLGTLAMAAGSTPSGSQFYVVVGRGPDPDYNVFGRCETETAKAISEVPRAALDRPVTDVHMQRIDIARCANGMP